MLRVWFQIGYCDWASIHNFLSASTYQFWKDESNTSKSRYVHQDCASVNSWHKFHVSSILDISMFRESTGEYGFVVLVMRFEKRDRPRDRAIKLCPKLKTHRNIYTIKH